MIVFKRVRIPFFVELQATLLQYIASYGTEIFTKPTTYECTVTNFFFLLVTNTDCLQYLVEERRRVFHIKLNQVIDLFLLKIF
jgi:hypothetical protein